MTSKQRIAVISEDLAEPWDEGIKKFTWSVARALGEDHDVVVMNVDRHGVGATASIVQIPGTRTFANRELRRRLRAFAPTLVLYVPSPSNTLASNLRCAMLRLHAGGAPIVMVGLIPRYHPGLKGRLVRVLAPDLTMVPSYRSLLRLSRLHVRGGVLPVGVDLGAFAPVDPARKARIRERLGVRGDAFLYLHVGHVRSKRNVVALTVLKEQAGAEVIVIGSTSTPQNEAVRERLERAGVRTIREFVDVADYYHAADCYVFPVEDDEGCVEMPLSVLEALASGVPVLATPFGGLPDFFYEGNDVMYWRSEEDLRAAAERMRNDRPQTTRPMDDFSWRRIAGRILEEAGVV